MTLERRWWFPIAFHVAVRAVMLGLTDEDRAVKWLARHAIKYGTKREEK